ncbi:hypothetical protein HUW46_09326 [Amycolatopsis sp. CA-230715]|nr:hypothetical protein HUW46_09326 [Amycolatopsis sp. CA-230715]
MVLATDADVAIRRAALHVPASLDRHRPRVTSVLRAAIDDPDALVRVGAICALARLCGQHGGGPAGEDRAWMRRVAAEPVRCPAPRCVAALVAWSWNPGDTTALEILAETVSDECAELVRDIPGLSEDLDWWGGYVGWACAEFRLPSPCAAELVRRCMTDGTGADGAGLRGARGTLCRPARP